jgi:hypothetical protein
VIGKLYGSVRARGVFVIARDGRITHRIISFNVLSQDAYSELEKAVDQATGGSGPP